MLRQGVASDVTTYSAFFSACEKGNQPERALELFDAMQRQGAWRAHVISAWSAHERSAWSAHVRSAWSAHVRSAWSAHVRKPERALELNEANQWQGVVPNVMPESTFGYLEVKVLCHSLKGFQGGTEDPCADVITYMSHKMRGKWLKHSFVPCLFSYYILGICL